jgi:hypothetical protein
MRYVPLCRRILLLFIALPILVSPAAFCAERITFGQIRVFPDIAKNRAIVEGIVWQAARTAEKKFGQYIAVSEHSGGAAAHYSVGITAVLEEENPAVVVSMIRESDGAEAQQFSLLGHVSQETAG